MVLAAEHGSSTPDWRVLVLYGGSASFPPDCVASAQWSVMEKGDNHSISQASQTKPTLVINVTASLFSLMKNGLDGSSSLTNTGEEHYGIVKGRVHMFPLNKSRRTPRLLPPA